MLVSRMISGRRKIFHWIVFDGDCFAHRCDVSDRTFQPRLCGIRRCVRRDAAGRPTRVFGTRAQLAFTLLKIALRNTQQWMRSPIFSCVRSRIGRITDWAACLNLFQEIALLDSLLQNVIERAAKDQDLNFQGRVLSRSQ